MATTTECRISHFSSHASTLRLVPSLERSANRAILGVSAKRLSTSTGSEPVEPRLAYRIDDAAQLLSVSRSTLYRLIDSGDLTAIRIGSDLRVTHEALSRFCASLDRSARLASEP